MKMLRFTDSPLKVFGVPFFEETKTLKRLPDSIMEKLPNLSFLGKRCPGARLCFRTDAESFDVTLTFKTLSVDIGMSIFSCQSAAVLLGDRRNFRLEGLISPPDYNTKTSVRTVKKSSDMEDVTIFLPRNEIIEDLTLTFPDDVKVEEPTPYTYGPVVFYGSSITEGGCCQSIFNAYNAILSNRLNMDYYNLGFSGNARGELIVADFINTIPMKAFVFDYDHNAPTVEHLRNTHEAFFLRIREKNPNLPIIMMSRPGRTERFEERREIVKSTYENAVARGDENVYFIDGQTFFGDKDRNLCLVDNIHPNDLGFYRMAEVIEPIIKKALGIEKV